MRLTKGFLDRIGALRKDEPDWISDKNLTNALSERLRALCKEEDQDWFSSLSETAQDQLIKRITPFFEKRRLDLPISALQPWMAHACYQNAKHLTGMDYFLVDHYKNHVTGLESLEDLLPFIKGTIDLPLFDQELCADASGQLPPDPTEEEVFASFQNGILWDGFHREVVLRNLNWVPKISSLHAFGTLFGVGICHLKDLLDRLEIEGFKIRRINPDATLDDCKWGI